MMAVRMKTSRDNYPIWSVDVELPRGAKIEYKFIKRLTQKTGNTEVAWEALQTGNRLVKTLDRAKVKLTESFSDCFIRIEEILPDSASISQNLSMNKASQSEGTGYTSGPPDSSKLTTKPKTPTYEPVK